MGIVQSLTAEELAAGAKGYWVRFDDYVDLEDQIVIPRAEYDKMVAWCEPYMERRHEVQGAVRFDTDDAGVRIRRAYVMGGNSLSLRSTCKLDGEDMLRQIQADYPDCVEFRANEVGWWHLHPGYFPVLSVGDIVNRRATMRGWKRDWRSLELLMYGDRAGYQLSGYLVGTEEVNRLPVRILE